MAQSKSEVSFEGTMSLSEVLAYLEGFTASLREGAVRVEQGEDQVILRPGEAVALAVKAKSKKSKQSVRLELSWDASEPEPVE